MTSTAGIIIIGDEICNGTETQSAIKLVYATLLKLLKLNTNFIFATHLHELNDIEDLDIIRKHHLSIKYDGDKNIKMDEVDHIAALYSEKSSNIIKLNLH